MSKKKKKEKIVYIDDNSTVADMSAVGGGKRQRSSSTFKEKWKTYLAAVKMMIIPMLAVLAAFTVMYILLLLGAGRL